jgi:hypothetical protein
MAEKGREMSQESKEEMEWTIMRPSCRTRPETTTCDGRILGVKMTYADEAMTGVTASSGLARLKVSRPRR